jgi:translation initiation factor IF-2
MVRRRPENVDVEIPSRLTVKQLGELLEVQPRAVIKILLGNGVLVTLNQQIDYDAAAIAARDLGFRPRRAPAR